MSTAAACLLLWMLALSPALSQASGFGVLQNNILATDAASIDSLGAMPSNAINFSTVDYRTWTANQNLVDYCSNTDCGACSLLPASDPCQAVDGYASNSSICLLPVFLGGTVPETSLCGVGANVEVPAPDGSPGAAAYVTVFRNTSGYLFIGVVMSCDWLMVINPSGGQDVAGSVAYSTNLLDFIDSYSASSLDPMSLFERYSCFTIPIELQGLSSNCQDLQATISLFFSAQRFAATDPETCSQLSGPYNVSAEIDLGLQSTSNPATPTAPAPAAPQPPPPPIASTSSTSATSDSTGTTTTTSAVPAVLAVFQLQLDLSGTANIWMSNLSGSCSSSDVQVLGHDVGVLVALIGDDPCSSETPSSLVATVSATIGVSGGAVRAWACLSDPINGTVDEDQLPSCAASDDLPVLALALRLPPPTTADWVVSTLSAALPQSPCLSSASQLDIRTDIQVQILGQIPASAAQSPPPADTAAASDSVGGSGEYDGGALGFWAAAMSTQPMLVPPTGSPVSLQMPGVQGSQSTYSVLAAAMGVSATTAPPPSSLSSPSPPYPSPGHTDAQSAGGSQSPARASPATLALAVVLGIVALAAIAVAFFFIRRKRLAAAASEKLAMYHVMDASPLKASPRTSLSCSSSTQMQHRVSSLLTGRRSVPYGVDTMQVWNSNTVYDVEGAVKAGALHSTPAVVNIPASAAPAISPGAAAAGLDREACHACSWGSCSDRSASANKDDGSASSDQKVDRRSPGAMPFIPAIRPVGSPGLHAASPAGETRSLMSIRSAPQPEARGSEELRGPASCSEEVASSREAPAQPRSGVGAADGDRAAGSLQGTAALTGHSSGAEPDASLSMELPYPQVARSLAWAARAVINVAHLMAGGRVPAAEGSWPHDRPRPSLAVAVLACERPEDRAAASGAATEHVGPSSSIAPGPGLTPAGPAAGVLEQAVYGTLTAYMSSPVCSDGGHSGSSCGGFMPCSPSAAQAAPSPSEAQASPPPSEAQAAPPPGVSRIPSLEGRPAAAPRSVFSAVTEILGANPDPRSGLRSHPLPEVHEEPGVLSRALMQQLKPPVELPAPPRGASRDSGPVLEPAAGGKLAAPAAAASASELTSSASSVVSSASTYSKSSASAVASSPSSGRRLANAPSSGKQPGSSAAKPGGGKGGRAPH